MKHRHPSAALAGLAILATGLTAAQALTLNKIGRYEQPEADAFDESAAEIGAFDPVNRRLFVTNAYAKVIDVLDLSDPTDPTLLLSIDTGDGGPTSCVVAGGVLAVAVPAEDKTSPGKVKFYATDTMDGAEVAEPVTVGALPDNIVLAPDGETLLTANEGEPEDYNTGDPADDPEGSVSIIDISGGVASAAVTTVGFEAFNDDVDALRAAGVRIFGPGASVAQDLEPEYIAVSPDGSTAYVTLQENNALGIIDLSVPEVVAVVPLGLKNHFAKGNGLDPSNRDDIVGHIKRNKVLGMFQPDAIAALEHEGATYLVTANEGDARDYDGYSEEARVADLPDEGFFFAAPTDLIGDDARLGRLNSTTAPPETAILGVTKKGKTILNRPVAFGARSFSVWDGATGALVWDSGDEFEQMTLALAPDIFNASNDDPEPDNRSDDKGPEPEGVVIGTVGGTPCAFIGLERIGGVMAYDLSDPTAPVFAAYANTRLPESDPDNSTVADDLGPEGLVFIPAGDSPSGEDLLVVANEVSGSVVVFSVTP